jgi:hypothetical protein
MKIQGRERRMVYDILTLKQNLEEAEKKLQQMKSRSPKKPLNEKQQPPPSETEPSQPQQ